jgi:predicted Zn finger-like uncharacterized protein
MRVFCRETVFKNKGEFMNDPLDRTGSDDKDGLINGYDCPHCGIWFHVDDGKPVDGRKNAIKCPNCDWVINKVV